MGHTANTPAAREHLREVYRFPGEDWCEKNTIGFNPYRTRSFINAEGKRVVISPCPIKIWQGMQDPTVDPIMVQKYVESARRSGSFIELRTLEDAAHKVSLVMREELRLWFDRFIGKGKGCCHCDSSLFDKTGDAESVHCA